MLAQATDAPLLFDLKKGVPSAGPVFRFCRNPLHGLCLGLKVPDMGVRAVPRLYRNEPTAASCYHFGFKMGASFRHTPHIILVRDNPNRNLVPVSRERGHRDPALVDLRNRSYRLSYDHKNGTQRRPDKSHSLSCRAAPPQSRTKLSLTARRYAGADLNYVGQL